MSQEILNNLPLESFPLKAFDKIRYADTDSQGHVNNAVFNTFLETGRIELIYGPEVPLSAETSALVIANLNMNFIAEIHWPGQIDIGTGILKVGNSSITILQNLFQNDQCVASAKTVIVHMDSNIKKSSPLPDPARDALNRYLLK